jgi:hypothetical protein
MEIKMLAYAEVTFISGDGEFEGILIIDSGQILIRAGDKTLIKKAEDQFIVKQTPKEIMENLTYIAFE